MEPIQTFHQDSAAFLDSIHRKAFSDRTPLAGGLELTTRCNLRCVHCYLSDSDSQKITTDTPASRIMMLLDEMADAGCLYLLITGGEPLLRPDFPALYRHAKERGFIITLFSNGTLISNSILELFRELPPRIIEISLYGASSETYEKVTGVKGSFDKCMTGIVRLLDIGMPVRLKTLIMTLNSHEFGAMDSLARELGIKFRFDPAIFPRLNGDRSPLKLRILPDKAIAADFADPDRAFQWNAFSKRFDGYVPRPDILYHCGAGRTSFYVDAHEMLRPCLMNRNLSIDLSDKPFTEGWASLTAAMDKKKSSGRNSCRGCKQQHLCGYCPSFFELETGSEETSSPYLCALGSHRHQHLQNMLSGASNGT